MQIGYRQLTQKHQIAVKYRSAQIGFIVLFTALFWHFSAMTREQTHADKLTCLTTHYPPFAVYQGKKKGFTGFDVVILERLAQRLNWQVEILNFPWGRVKIEIEKSNFNCFFSLSYTPQRAKFLAYTQLPMHVTQYGVFFLAGNEALSQQNFAGKNIGLIRSMPLPEPLLSHDQLRDANFVYLDSNETLLEILLTGRIDASITNFAVGNFLRDKLNLQDEVRSVVLSDYELPVYLAFRHGTQDMQQVNSALQSVIQTLHTD
jgi:polar amino acid transport system substrate-binding protein